MTPSLPENEFEPTLITTAIPDAPAYEDAPKAAKPKRPRKTKVHGTRQDEPDGLGN
jgi:hypothetical protein